MKKACVIGWPISHSRSPLIHNYWLKKYGIEGSYERIAVPESEVEVFLRGLQQAGYRGCNVTVPHKETAFRIADETLPAAKAVGAANTLWLEDGRLLATNSDTEGYMSYLNAKAPEWDAGAYPVTVLGAGGAARAIVFGLLEAGAREIRVVNRSAGRAASLCRHFDSRPAAWQWDERERAIEGAGLIVNTTALGLDGRSDLDINLSGARPDAIVSDIVYVPLETAFLKRAKAAGLKTVDGLGMLLHQAVPGFEKWFGVRPEVTDELYDLVAEDVRVSQC